MQQIAILGAGVMGQGIAQLCAQAGFTTWLYDIDAQALERGRNDIRSALEKRRDKGRLSEAEVSQTLERLTTTTALDDLAQADLVIEAVVEKLVVKHRLMQQLEVLCPADTLLVSNTSSLSIEAIAESTGQPGRVAGMHFFNPAPVMKLVEVVAGPATSDEAVTRLTNFARQLGKTPVLVKDSPGFIVNRCARPFYSEALFMLEQGVASVDVIDACLKSNAGVPLGPFELMDLVGLDINLHATEALWQAYRRHPRFAPAEAVRSRVQSGQLGRKAGRGFYTYPRPAKAVAEAPSVSSATALAEHLQSQLGFAVVVTDGRLLSSRLPQSPALCLDHSLLAWQAGPVDLACTGQHLSAEQWRRAFDVAAEQGIGLHRLEDTPGLIVVRMVSQLYREACLLAEEGIAAPEDIDTALQLGLNFARGPFALQQQAGSEAVATVQAALQVHDNSGRYVPAGQPPC
ncbi:MAG: 3-hydroxyacyl-CoA dehydrogenase NAD-binding domain-containing protein [Saccharospirillum sp.]